MFVIQSLESTESGRRRDEKSTACDLTARWARFGPDGLGDLGDRPDGGRFALVEGQAVVPVVLGRYGALGLYPYCVLCNQLGR